MVGKSPGHSPFYLEVNWSQAPVVTRKVVVRAPPFTGLPHFVIKRLWSPISAFPKKWNFWSPPVWNDNACKEKGALVPIHLGNIGLPVGNPDLSGRTSQSL